MGEDPMQVPLYHVDFWVQIHNLSTGLMSEEGFYPGRIMHAKKELSFEWDLSIKVLLRRAMVAKSFLLRQEGDNSAFLRNVGAYLGINLGKNKEGNRRNGENIDPDANTIKLLSLNDWWLGNPRAICRLQHVLREANPLSFFIEVNLHISRMEKYSHENQGGWLRDERGTEAFQSALNDCELSNLGYVELSREDPDDYAFEELVITKMQLNMENDKGERYWEQWALANWLDIGDRNMTLFHRFASHQNWLKIIDQLKKQNGWTFVGDEGIEFRLEEVIATLHNISPTKVSGDNGMPTIFYKKYWNIISDELVISFLSEMSSSVAPKNKRRFEKGLYEVVNVRFEVWEAKNSINCFQDKEALAFGQDKLSGIKEARTTREPDSVVECYRLARLRNNVTIVFRHYGAPPQRCQESTSLCTFLNDDEELVGKTRLKWNVSLKISGKKGIQRQRDHMELVEEEAGQGLSWADRPSAGNR
ncbi:hypothetical protein Goarm_020398, partial [Gossypium armourianum]|nr:hypothetical protein [Gossypium armourianum]